MAQRLEDLFQTFASGSVDKQVEVISGQLFRFVESEQFLCHLHAIFCRELAQQRSELRVVRKYLSTEGHKVGRHTALFMRQSGRVKTNVGNRVMGAAVRAARDLHAQRPGQLGKLSERTVEGITKSAAQTFGRCNAQTASIGPWAGSYIRNCARAAISK